MPGSSPRFVSCIMATRDRREFIPEALRCFARQTYQDAELIVVDDGRESVGDLCQGIPRVRHIQLYRPATTGTKLNIGIQRARGDILQKIDDDDYYHPDFLKLAVARLPSRTSVRTLVAWDCFLVLLAGETHLRHSGHGWEAGGTFCFYRKLWECKAVSRCRKGRRLLVSSTIIARNPAGVCRRTLHAWFGTAGIRGNLCSGEAVDSYFHSLPPYPKELDAVVPPEDLAFYRSLQSAALLRDEKGHIAIRLLNANIAEIQRDNIPGLGRSCCAPPSRYCRSVHSWKKRACRGSRTIQSDPGGLSF